MRKYVAMIILCSSFAPIIKAQEKDMPVFSDNTSITFFSTRSTNLLSLATTSRSDTIPCLCAVAPQILPVSREGRMWTFRGIPNASCAGGFITTIAAVSPGYLLADRDLQDTCSVNNVRYFWSIVSGSSVAQINGSNFGSTVNISIIDSGQFTLNLVNEVTCSDSSTCSYSTDFTDTARVDTVKKKSCNISREEKVEPKMDGGLKAKYSGAKKIFRDDFIVLGAEGKDYDQVTFSCTPSSDCNETSSNKTVVLTGRVRFEWTITGEGNFVKLGCLPENTKTDKGDHVIFQPPFVPLPVVANDTMITTTIQLLMIDDNPTQPKDDNVMRAITITTRRFKNSLDEYTVNVQSPAYTLPGIPSPVSVIGTCKAQGPAWEMKTDLKKPEIELPDVTDKNKMVVGEWIVLNAKDQRDGDKLKMVCNSDSCEDSGDEKIYEDNVDWEWTIVAPGTLAEKGRFVSDPKGRFVVYEAPGKLPKDSEVVEVKIRVTVKNPEGLQLTDDVPMNGEITLKIHKAGVKLEYPPLTWVPEESNHIDVKSLLVFREAGKWNPALAHQCRIHFFELVNISTEKGVCMNDPVPDEANQCRDLHIKNERQHEAFNDKKGGTCTVNQLFQEARTQKPAKEYSLRIHARDFGAYGFLRSEAALKNKTPEYVSVPVLKTEVDHPGGANRTKSKEYNDNRINIPKDIDENKIADGGWTVTGGGRMSDPASNKADEDSRPAGDGFNGDGFTAYEEYRGFRVIGAEPGSNQHIRTAYNRKDLFIHNNDLPLNLFAVTSGLIIHPITSDQYISDNNKLVNFNFNPQLHETNQLGIFLINGGNHLNLLGIAEGANGQPAPPNWVNRVIVYRDKVTAFSGPPRNLNFNDKLSQITAHELAHACNVYHHGEGDPNQPGQINQVNGLRSGDMSCIMRYDNINPNAQEAIGNIFCTSPEGTGTNANNRGFGNANNTLCRGNCTIQFRVSGRQANYPRRLTANDCRKIRNP